MILDSPLTKKKGKCMDFIFNSKEKRRKNATDILSKHADDTFILRWKISCFGKNSEHTKWPNRVSIAIGCSWGSNLCL